jgi:hypothetical protein
MGINLEECVVDFTPQNNTQRNAGGERDDES